MVNAVIQSSGGTVSLAGHLEDAYGNIIPTYEGGTTFALTVTATGTIGTFFSAWATATSQTITTFPMNAVRFVVETITGGTVYIGYCPTGEAGTSITSGLTSLTSCRAFTAGQQCVIGWNLELASGDGSIIKVADVSAILSSIIASGRLYTTQAFTGKLLTGSGLLVSGAGILQSVTVDGPCTALIIYNAVAATAGYELYDSGTMDLTDATSTRPHTAVGPWVYTNGIYITATSATKISGVYI